MNQSDDFVDNALVICNHAHAVTLIFHSANETYVPRVCTNGDFLLVSDLGVGNPGWWVWLGGLFLEMFLKNPKFLLVSFAFLNTLQELLMTTYVISLSV